MRVEKLVHGGESLARVNGEVMLISGALPGELVEVEVQRARPGLVRARAAGIVEKSPLRVEPKCRYFARCGGCQYQHAAYAYQTAQKLEILQELLRRVGKIEPPAEIALVTGPEWEYRNRVQLHFENDKAGFHEAGSHTVCAVDECVVASPRLNQAIASFHRMMRQPAWPGFLKSVELFSNESQVQVNVLDSGPSRLSAGFFRWCAESMPGALDSALDYAACGEVFRVSHKSFFQVNRFLVDRLVEVALDGVEGERALDLFAGVGLFSLPLARRIREVTAVEVVRSAVADLEFNASRAKLTLRVEHTPVEAYLSRRTEPPDFAIADPPRAGLGARVVADLVRLKPRVLVVVACDASTLARDLGGLVAGGFALDRMTMVDLLPHTAHIEVVARLKC